jgi:hypothetical protein
MHLNSELQTPYAIIVANIGKCATLTMTCSPRLYFEVSVIYGHFSIKYLVTQRLFLFLLPIGTRIDVPVLRK